MIHPPSLHPDPTDQAEIVVESGRTDTTSTNLVTEDPSLTGTATLGIVASDPNDLVEADPEVTPEAGAGNFCIAAAILGLGGVAIILVWHFCSGDHDFIAALIGVAFCLSGWALASRSFPHTTREYSTSSRRGDETR